MRLQEEKEQAWADVERSFKHLFIIYFIYLLLLRLLLRLIVFIRREQRVGDWRDFQEDPDSKRVRLANFKEETRVETKHGVVKLNEWKRKWK